ncbi:MAG TPA: NAD+ synthase [Planctomycetota bacterium]|nr:NAD+ synthase [Planctomycetota bacterium]
MKIALAQINPTIGDFEGNCRKIADSARSAAKQGAELTIFSEMCVMGYPARDLLEKPAFLNAQDRAIEQLRAELKSIPIILGYVRRRSGDGNALHNSCALIESGEITTVADKCLLPTYDVFDEDRYFEEAKGPVLAQFKGKRVGLTICEDAWNDKDYWSARKYAYDPVCDLVDRGAEVIVNLSASPFSLGKQAAKEGMLAALARKHRRPLLYVNQVGGNDDLLFDGRSLAFDADGHLLARGPAFEEGVTLVDLGTKRPFTDARGGSLSEEEEIHRALVMGTRDYARKCGFKSAVLGLSGGIDSALVGALAAEAFGPENVTGVALPSRFNAPESLADAKDLAERLGINFHVVAIENLFGEYKNALSEVFAGKKEDVTEENLQARIRGVLLMAISNKFGHLLLTTGNKSELATGYCTLYGDMCGGLAVISDLYKTMVYRVSKYLNARHPQKPPIPISSIEKAPTAELRFNQKDQDTLPPYDVLDGILKASIEEHRTAEEIVAMGHDREVVRKVLRMVDLNEYKRRQAAPGLKLTSKAFGTGRRMPIAQRFRDGM